MIDKTNVRVGLGPISVFCGASEYPYNEKNPFRQTNLKHQQEIEKFGQILAHAGIPLIWGAGQTGLMGAVSRSVIDHGGKAIGVSTAHLVNGKEGAQKGITTLLVADSMQSRKMAFAKLSRAFVIFPGGIGTFDEVTEYLLERENGEHMKPLVIVNIDGFFEPLLSYFDHLVTTKYMTQEARDMLVSVPGADQVLPAITAEMEKAAKYYKANPTRVREETLIGQHNQVMLKKHEGHLPIGRHNYPKCELGVGTVAIICGGSDAALHEQKNVSHRYEIEKLIKLLGEHNLPRIIHSGQSSGLKGVVSRTARKHGIADLGVTTKFLEECGGIDWDSQSLLVADNEQSAEFAIKNLVDAVIIGPGAIDSLEKLSDYLTEVDIKESNQRLIIFNVEGHYDGLVEYFRYLVQRGYFAPAALDKLVIVSKAEDVITALLHPAFFQEKPGLMTKDDLIAAKPGTTPQAAAPLAGQVTPAAKPGEYPRYPLTADTINKLIVSLGLASSDA